MTRRSPSLAGRATDREVGVAAAVLVAGSEKAAAHRLGLSHSTVTHHLANARSKVGAAAAAQLVWILAPRLPEPEGMLDRWWTRDCGPTRCRSRAGMSWPPSARTGRLPPQRLVQILLARPSPAGGGAARK